MSLFVSSHGITVVVLNNLCKRLDLNSNFYFPVSVNNHLFNGGLTMVWSHSLESIRKSFGFVSCFNLNIFKFKESFCSPIQNPEERSKTTLGTSINFLFLYFAQNNPLFSFQNDFKFPLHTSSNHVVHVILSFYKFPSSHYSQP